MRVLVRSTVHLPGLPRGSEAFADTDEPRVAAFLRAGFVIVVNGDDEKPLETSVVSDSEDTLLLP